MVPEQPAPDLFLISLRALAHLNYSDLPPELLTMAFEMHLMAQLGFAPRMDECVHLRPQNRRRCAVRRGAGRRGVPELSIVRALHLQRRAAHSAEAAAHGLRQGARCWTAIPTGPRPRGCIEPTSIAASARRNSRRRWPLSDCTYS